MVGSNWSVDLSNDVYDSGLEGMRSLNMSELCDIVIYNSALRVFSEHIMILKLALFSLLVVLCCYLYAFYSRAEHLGIVEKVMNYAFLFGVVLVGLYIWIVSSSFPL